MAENNDFDTKKVRCAERLGITSAGIPRHIAIVMDGNGRWATERGLPRFRGHEQGAKVVQSVAQYCVDNGVEFLTLFAFSSENWKRPQDEVGTLMRLFVSALQKEVGKLSENGVRMRVVGDLGAFDSQLQSLIRDAEQRTRHNTRLQLTVCASYGGRWDIVQSVRSLLAGTDDPQALARELTEEQLAEHLALSFAPDPDLLIRTGGEQRLSDFLLWECAYAEMVFSPKMWPEYSAADLAGALETFGRRERRFGKVAVG